MQQDLPQVDIAAKRQELEDLETKLRDTVLLQNPKELAEITRKYNHLRDLVQTWEKLQAKVAQLEQSRQLTDDKDPQMAELALEDTEALKEEIQAMAEHMNVLTMPELEHDRSNAIVEVRAGTGGVEASLFAEEIYRMYLRYLQTKGYSSEQIEIHRNDEGGIKEVVFSVQGEGAYGLLRFEGGVHRVQRVPATEASGRIHTSAASVAVLPEIPKEDVDIHPGDLVIEVFRSSGPGGQSVNTTDSAVRITHKPSGITVSSQDSKSQHKNKEQAMSVLASKLYEMEQERLAASRQAIRTAAIKTGDRSAKIRTYNFPQDRLTDHRIRETWHNLARIMSGEIEDVVSTVNSKLRSILQ